LETKICTKCGEEKELNKSNFIWRGTYWVGECRECNNKARRRKNTNTDNKVFVSNTLKEDYMNKLNEEQYNKLINLINNYNELISMINSKIEINKADKSQRVHKTLNIDKGLYEILEKHARKNNVSVSDVVNSVIEKGIEFL